jgi:hypothetical protein
VASSPGRVKSKTIDIHLPTNEQFFSYMMARTSYIRGDDDDARFVLDQHAELDFYSAS